jgi:sulfur carrier protein
VTSHVTVNGEPFEAPAGTTVAELALRAGIKPGTAAAVELNGLVLPRAEWATRLLVAGDRVEIVILVGGG